MLEESFKLHLLCVPLGLSNLSNKIKCLYFGKKKLNDQRSMIPSLSGRTPTHLSSAVVYRWFLSHLCIAPDGSVDLQVKKMSKSFMAAVNQRLACKGGLPMAWF